MRRNSTHPADAGAAKGNGNRPVGRVGQYVQRHVAEAAAPAITQAALVGLLAGLAVGVFVVLLVLTAATVPMGE